MLDILTFFQNNKFNEIVTHRIIIKLLKKSIRLSGIYREILITVDGHCCTCPAPTVCMFGGPTPS
jgi:hypothetical protein